jgi:hypothetical protein
MTDEGMMKIVDCMFVKLGKEPWARRHLMAGKMINFTTFY